MKFICGKERLLKGINTVQKAVSTKTTLQMLEGILIEAYEELKLTGNDLEIGIESIVEADIIEKGKIVLNAKIFGEIIRRMPESEILMELEENNAVKIECGNSHFKINGISAEGFPALPQVKKENVFKIRQDIFRDMIRQTVFSVGTDENRPMLTGSLIECVGDELVFVSIDGFRMALRRCRIKEEGGGFKAIVPGKTLNEILKILEPSTGEILIYCTKNQAMFEIEDCKVVSRLLEGEYLNYKGIIPQEFETKTTVNRRELLNGIERASLIIMSEERRCPIRFNINGDAMVLTTSTQIGNVREEITVETEGSGMDISFNPRYFIEALRVIDDEMVDLYFTSGVGPCLVKPVEGDSFVYMILPVRR